MPVYISQRLSIRWLPDDASEPTDTIVLSGAKTGCFLDVRFLKGSDILDWAFAGYRTAIRPDAVRFIHQIDSKTLTPEDVDDHGTNTVLPDGTTLEAGQMVNPSTGAETAYEEIWSETEEKRGVLVRNAISKSWKMV